MGGHARHAGHVACPAVKRTVPARGEAGGGGGRPRPVRLARFAWPVVHVVVTNASDRHAIAMFANTPGQRMNRCALRKRDVIVTCSLPVCSMKTKPPGRVARPAPVFGGCGHPDACALRRSGTFVARACRRACAVSFSRFSPPLPARTHVIQTTPQGRATHVHHPFVPHQAHRGVAAHGAGHHVGHAGHQPRGRPARLPCARARIAAQRLADTH